MSFSAELRGRTAGDWDAAVTHRFVQQLWHGTAEPAVLRTYFVQDNQFLDSFVALLGAAVASADQAGPRLVLARQLGLIAGPENDFFTRALDALGVPAAEREAPPLSAPTAGFLELMDRTRLGADYGTCLAVLLVAEWLYLDWADRDGEQPPTDPINREWIELHRGPAFSAWVDFLRAEFDRIAILVGDDARARLASTFTHVVELERQFFDAAY
ncbi:TenA family protein [Pseudonocardia spinosispora]|uniref:TenA family protein n=1 Tax=Pseudonocardia spinosispora TaxID=103441 RepID=UPI0004911FF8|nr:TenA family protein [Pseudonocardia spinosispora]